MNTKHKAPVAAHSPTPWRIEGLSIFANDDYHVAYVEDEPRSPVANAAQVALMDANADFIVRACNSHTAHCDCRKFLNEILFRLSEGMEIDESLRHYATDAVTDALAAARGENS